MGNPTVRILVLAGMTAAVLSLPSMFAGALAESTSSRARLGVEPARVILARAQVRRESRKERRSKGRIERAGAAQQVRKSDGPRSPHVAIVSLRQQTIQVYGADGLVAQSRVSTGQARHRTPAGVFSILQRNRHHESNIYSGAPMPYMQRLTWSGIALHQGHVPGYPASHGCIRLPGSFASNLWGIGHIGMRVIVSPASVTPAPIAHDTLPKPLMTPIASVPDMVPHLVRLASAGDVAAAPDPTVLDPYKLAVARKAKLQADQKTTAAAVKPAFTLAAESAALANAASAALRQSERSLAIAEEDVRAADAAVTRATDEESKAKVSAAIAEARERLASARAAYAAALAEERARSDAAFEAVKAAKAAAAAAEDVKSALRDAVSAVEPVSIFVSRKEARVYVRQGFAPIHDEAIEISDPDVPIGTHVFTAMDAVDNGAQLSWSVVSVADRQRASNDDDDRSSRRRKRGVPAEASPEIAPPTAQQALDRFAFPEATRKLIADRLWPGASLIVSDHGISGETGRGTDFVVLTR